MSIKSDMIKGGSLPPKIWNYSSKYIKQAPKGWNKYITNTKTLVKDAQIAPKNRVAAGITNKIDNAIHFYLNDSIGQGGYEKNISTNFDRLYSVYPEFELADACTYVFFVRPDLNIIDTKTNKLASLSENRGFMYSSSCPARDQFYKWMYKTYPHVLMNISGRGIKGHQFMPLLTGRVEAINLPDYTIKDYKLTQPFTGYNMPYASHALESMTGGEFEVTFRDNNDMMILKLFQAWVQYISNVTRNVFSPRLTYVRNNRADYCTSVYVITCKGDASEIVHWVKYTGAFPTKVPHSNLSFNLRGGVNNKVTIPFAYFHQEPINPLSIIDFNKNANVKTDASKVKYKPIYESVSVSLIGLKDKRSTAAKKVISPSWKYSASASVSAGTGNGLVGCPFICKIKNKYYLRWKSSSVKPIG